MFELVKKMFKNKIDNISNEIIKIKYDESTNTFNISIDKNIKVKINGKFDFELGETNITTHGDFNLDTWKSTLNLNSRKSNHIKDLPEAIAFRKEVSEAIQRHKIWIDHHKVLIDKIDKVVKEYEDEQLALTCKKCNEDI